MNKSKRIGRKPVSIMRSILTGSRKLKIAEFKQNEKTYPDRYGVRGCARWNAKLLQYINDPVLTIDDIERWVRTHSWITAEDQQPRPARPARSLRRSRSLPWEATPARFPTPRSASKANSDRKVRGPTYGQQYQNRTPKKNHNVEPHTLEPMVTISPQLIDFGNVVNADNYQIQRMSSPVSSISQRYFVEIEDAHEMSGVHMEENDNGNPLEPPQYLFPQQWPNVYEGLGRHLIASPAQQQFTSIPANQIQFQSHGNENGNSSQFILPDRNGNNSSDVPENNPPPSMNVEDPSPPIKTTKEDNKSGDIASDLNLGMRALGELSQICGRHDELRSCLLSIEKIFTVMQRAQKRTLLVFSHKDALDAAVVAKNKKIIKMENVEEGGVAGRSGTPAENEMDCPIPAEVDLTD